MTQIKYYTVKITFFLFVYFFKLHVKYLFYLYIQHTGESHTIKPE